MRRPVWKSVERVRFAIAHPGLLIKRLSGKSIIEIRMDEIRVVLPDVRVAVEAGALNGSDTEAISMTWPQAVVHAFEPVPEAFAEVRERVGQMPNVRLYEEALSTGTGTADMYVSVTEDGGYFPDSSSLLEPGAAMAFMTGVGFARDRIVVSTVTLDDWAEREGVPGVDLLWLDLQGMELHVLQAAPRITGTARAVVMEVSRREIYKGVPLYPEVKRWMRTQGFEPVIERISYLFGNVLFVRPEIAAD